MATKNYLSCSAVWVVKIYWHNMYYVYIILKEKETNLMVFLKKEEYRKSILLFFFG